jgi:hypothetical protein
MAKCVLCGAETCLYVNGTPVCIVCADKQQAETKRKPVAKEEAQDGEQTGTES